MATVQKFLFDRSFDEPGSRFAQKTASPPANETPEAPPEAPAVEDEDAPYAGLDRRRRSTDAPPPEPPPDLYTAAQLEAAREEGYLKGHATALEDHGASTQQATAQALAGIKAALERLETEQVAFNADVEKAVVRLAVALVRRMLPATATQCAVAEVQELLAATLPDVLDQPRLIIRVHGSLAEIIRQTVGPILEDHGFDGRLTVRPDNDLPVTDCRLEWGDGGVERDSPRLWAEIEAAVARHLDEPVPPPPSPPRTMTPDTETDTDTETETDTDTAATAVPPPMTRGPNDGLAEGDHHG